jgi:lysozyme
MKTRLRKAGTAGGAIGALTACGVLAVQQVGGFEGLRLAAYRDVVGIWTICYGETAGVKPGQKFSKETCDNLLVSSLIGHEQGMRKCLQGQGDALPIEVYVADLSLTYNVGVGAFCKSTVARLQNAGQVRESCGAFMKFVKAGGRVVNGLVKRRLQERALCLKGAS